MGILGLEQRRTRSHVAHAPFSAQSLGWEGFFVREVQPYRQYEGA